MSYFAASALQTALFNALAKNTGLPELTDKNLFDTPPRGTLPDLYVLLGEERVLDRSSVGAPAAEHEFTLSVYSTKAGFLSVKRLAAKICESLEAGTLSLGRTGRMVSLSFVSARANRGNQDERRQIHLLFRAYIDAA